jgi:type III pantothenate kinase
MTPDVVVDIGNTRIKWGRCSGPAVSAAVGLPPDDRDVWQKQADAWQLPAGAVWVLTGVHPVRCDRLADWLRQRGDRVHVITEARFLPLRVLLEKPDHVGIDRLLDGVAANSRRRARTPAVVVDAGSAVTVDYLDEDGAFRGGAILPGLRLMAVALHTYTALLPLVEVPRAVPGVPGTATPAAVTAGIFWAVAGGIRGLIEAYAKLGRAAPEVYLTGGDGELLAAVLPGAVCWPGMTLEGIRLTAEALP